MPDMYIVYNSVNPGVVFNLWRFNNNNNNNNNNKNKNKNNNNNNVLICLT